MTNRIADISQRKAAIVAGVSFLIMFIAAIIAEFLARQSLVVPGDAATTANNIMANELLFRSGIFSYLIILILDVVLAWAFYVFLKPVNKSLSLLAAWFRLVYTAIFGIALLNLVTVLSLLSGADYLTVFETGQLYAQVMLSLNAFSDGWAIGYVFFSLHLFFLGYLAFKSGYIPRIMGVLLIIAGFGYLIDNLAKLVLPGYENYAAIILLIVFLPCLIGEMAFCLWLLFKGGKRPKMKK
ncbi:MAG: DUF4386 domain-containing protein [Calditrichaeota bacterium]|nr:DUF4386 domain-containing protein [Calditrichota bacterium]